eukprot:scaffold133201_cov34-Tisochrysis_lutea.AAC.1
MWQLQAVTAREYYPARLRLSLRPRQLFLGRNLRRGPSDHSEESQRRDAHTLNSMSTSAARRPHRRLRVALVFEVLVVAATRAHLLRTWPRDGREGTAACRESPRLFGRENGEDRSRN